MAVEVDIWLALKARTESFATSRAIAWPGEAFEVPSIGGRLQPYLRVAFINATPARMLIKDGRPHERTGFLMLTMVYPIVAGVPLKTYLTEPAAIAAHFKDGTRTRYGNVCVSVPEYPYVMDGYEDEGYYTVPVRIPWRCFA